ncbi:MAG: hypothetical protein JOZ10_05795 [Acidobacteria bacterium]|nr:hypothetical protein [Acidobacteriota bacterium]MBV9145725.1 hypothetical protein [Acidobacteriota bacterium]MBV9437253.1 hypothetical protein [Acidobacteriota bacterium]
MQPPKPLKPQGAGLRTTDPQLGHETTDISLTGVVAFLITLGFSGIVIFVLLWGVYHFASNYAEQQDERDQRDPWVRATETQVDQGAAKLHTARNKSEEPGSMQLVDAQNRIRVSRFPQPRLQTDDAHDLSVMRQAEDVYLNQYFVLDKNSGKVNIPIEQAMQAVVQKGLPATQPQAGVEAVPTPEGTGIVHPSIKSSHSKYQGGVGIR